MDDGTELPFEKVFAGFYEQRRINISGLVYDVLSVVFPEYDANKNGFIEEPELTVLYLREGGLGMGFKVSHLKVKERVVALQTSKADVQALFHEINHLATQIRRRGQEAADQTFLGP
jgi:hypothetical protein